ncbi:MAG TPA: segregation/condensation protein A [Anaerolineae bacterium]|nr:segregation/condensation protein A [Anaerolineae bacterium]
MTVSVVAHQVSSIRVETPAFQGPLDLLLHLIERAELDITTIALAQVTEQYLAYLARLEDRSPDEVSAFLVVAARLLQIKSEALLPRPPQREEGEEDPGESLVEQLRLYKAFKERAGWLRQRHQAGLRTFLRTTPPPKAQARVDFSGLTLANLVEAARRAMAIAYQPPLRTVVTPPKITIRQKIRDLIRALRRRERVSFQREVLRQARSRLEVVVAFLALLELVKQHLVVAHQPGLFADIEIEPATQLDPEAEIASKFGE